MAHCTVYSFSVTSSLSGIIIPDAVREQLLRDPSRRPSVRAFHAGAVYSDPTAREGRGPSERAIDDKAP